MPIPDLEALYSRAVKIMGLARLTAAERSELLNIAQGFACSDSAAAEGVPAEAVRACRERIHRKLGATQAGTLISTLEMLAGVTPELRGEVARPDK